MRLGHKELDRDGCGVLRRLVPENLIADAQDETEALVEAGLRNPLGAFPSLARLARYPEIMDIVRGLLGPDARLTRAILFDKTPEKNWPVPPHRDTTIAVAEKIDMPGFGPWSIKEGVVHVRPPNAVLSRLWTIRVAIDAAPTENGPLRVQPGSHASSGREAEWRTMACDAGDVVVMKPLLMHASARATKPSRRRVLHLEWAPGPLPPPLGWASV